MNAPAIALVIAAAAAVTGAAGVWRATTPSACPAESVDIRDGSMTLLPEGCQVHDFSNGRRLLVTCPLSGRRLAK
jgi:hypothetical protein